MRLRGQFERFYEPPRCLRLLAFLVSYRPLANYMPGLFIWLGDALKTTSYGAWRRPTLLTSLNAPSQLSLSRGLFAYGYVTQPMYPGKFQEREYLAVTNARLNSCAGEAAYTEKRSKGQNP